MTARQQAIKRSKMLPSQPGRLMMKLLILSTILSISLFSYSNKPRGQKQLQCEPHNPQPSRRAVPSLLVSVSGTTPQTAQPCAGGGLVQKASCADYPCNSQPPQKAHRQDGANLAWRSGGMRR